MKIKSLLIFLSITIPGILFPGCSPAVKNRIMQASTIDALLSGAYDGVMSCRKLLDYGDFGIGTFDKLDGEMIVLNGKIYQMRSDGSVGCPEKSVTTPFATVCKFVPEINFILPENSGLLTTEAEIDKNVPNKNIFTATMIKAEFSSVKVRSVPVQQKPYTPLAEVTKNQPVFTYKNIKGIIVGFRVPVFVKGVNVPGYHFHFISDDLKHGGHVLDFEIISGGCSADVCNELLLILPEDEKSLRNIDFSKDRTSEMDQAEH